jgi:outer membrane protein OmpA-like peptidoglycan-associated protein
MRQRTHTPSWVLLASVTVLLAGTGPAFAQDPPETIPPNAARDIRSLRYVVENLAARVDDLRIDETDLEYRLELAADVLFDFDKAEIRAEAVPVLTRAAAFIKEHAKGPFTIEGHTDAKGGDSYNLKLSDRRAASVKTWLTTKGGLAAATVVTKGFGATRPVAPNAKKDGSDDPDGRQKNRRVEIIIRKKP